MSLSRRQALSGLSLGLTLIPFYADAQGGFAVLATAIGDTIVQSVKVIGAVTDQINQAVTSGIAIYDKIKLRELQNTLRNIEGQMVSVNSRKRQNVQEFTDYINNDPFSEKWTTIQEDCAVIATKLNRLLSSIGEDDTVLVAGTDFATAGDLKAALSRQASIYQRLSELTEPNTDSDRTQLKSIVAKLEGLLNEVIKLESSIQTYLNKFS